MSGPSTPPPPTTAASTPATRSSACSYAYTFTEPGTYPYFCRYHGDVGGVGMAGTIVVE